MALSSQRERLGLGQVPGLKAGLCPARLEARKVGQAWQNGAVQEGKTVAKSWGWAWSMALAGALVACGPSLPAPGGGSSPQASPSGAPASAAPSSLPSARPSEASSPSASPSPSRSLAQGPWRQVVQAPVGAWTMVGALGREDAVVANSTGQVSWTSSGGGSWTQSEVPMLPDDRLLAVGLWGPSRVWAAGRFGVYVLSADGRFWSRSFDFRSVEGFVADAVAFDGTATGVVTGRGETTRQGPAIILESSDQGATWKATHRVAAEAGLSVAAAGGQALVRTAKNWLTRTANGAWVSEAILSGGGNLACTAALTPTGEILARASAQGVLAGRAGALSLFTPAATWAGSQPAGCGGVLAAGGLKRAWYAENGTLWRSDNGGQAWLSESAGGVPTQALVATPEGAGWAVGQSQVWAYQ